MSKSDPIQAPSIPCVVRQAFVRGGRRFTPRPEGAGEEIVHLNPADARAFQSTGAVYLKASAEKILASYEAAKKAQRAELEKARRAELTPKATAHKEG